MNWLTLKKLKEWGFEEDDGKGGLDVGGDGLVLWCDNLILAARVNLVAPSEENRMELLVQSQEGDSDLDGESIYWSYSEFYKMGEEVARRFVEKLKHATVKDLDAFKNGHSYNRIYRKELLEIEKRLPDRMSTQTSTQDESTLPFRLKRHLNL